jgi:ADP-ribosylglycohydrolase
MSFENEKPFSEKILNWDGKTYHGSEYHRLNPGDTTDDTGMSLALAKSLTDCGTYNSEYTLKCYLEWF